MIVTPKVEQNVDAMTHAFRKSNGPISADSVSSSSSVGRPICRRRISYHPTLGYPIPPTVPPKVARRNARERNRVKQVNCGFEMLRSHIPSAAKAKKMSKVDTLRHAVEYIQNLQQMIDEQHVHQHLQNDGMSSHAMQTSLVQPPLTPTPSSRASSAPSPMTPHMNQVHQHHFVLPEPPTYPSPLTPRTPNTPVATDYMVPTAGYSPSCNDSGFDTSSFFSTNSTMSPNLMSPCHRSLQHPMQTGEMMASQGHHRGLNNLDQSPVSSNNYHRPTNQVYDMGSQYYNYNPIVTANPDEEELLDAIAKWQEQDD